MPQTEYPAWVADLYDAIVDVTLDVPFFLEAAQQADGPVLELMSGTGRVSVPLIEAGIPLTCVDNAPDMLNRLRAKLVKRDLAADVRLMDVTALNLSHHFDLIFIPFNAFAELRDADDQRHALNGIRAHLAPGGRFICTLHNPAVRRQRIDGQQRLWHATTQPDGSRLLLWGTEQFDPASGIVEALEIFEEFNPDGSQRTRRLFPLRFALLDPTTFEQQAAAAGFKIAARYGNYDRSPFDPASSPYAIWLLEA
jgi:SAM-dependent methyltransferase